MVENVSERREYRGRRDGWGEVTHSLVGAGATSFYRWLVNVIDLRKVFALSPNGAASL